MQRIPLASEFVPTAEANAQLTAYLVAMAAVDADVDLHFLDVAPPADPAVVFADLSEASYAGYSTPSVTVASMTVKQTEADGSRRVESTTLTTVAGPTTDGPATLYGVALTEGGATTRLYRVYTFDEPVILADDTQIFNYVASLTVKAGVQAG